LVFRLNSGKREKIVFMLYSLIKEVLEMNKPARDVFEKLDDLSDVEKLRLVDEILTDLDKPDPEIDEIWAEEARKRWQAYQKGKVSTVSYETVMSRHLKNES
jgi:putative addiction module component (TIGR02574 family)